MFIVNQAVRCHSYRACKFFLYFVHCTHLITSQRFNGIEFYVLFLITYYAPPECVNIEGARASNNMILCHVVRTSTVYIDLSAHLFSSIDFMRYHQLILTSGVRMLIVCVCVCSFPIRKISLFISFYICF